MMKRFIGFAGWPVALGLLVAVAVLLFQPDWLGGDDNVIQPTLEPTFYQDSLSPTSNEFGGSVSYANAVRRAAPAVVNNYTTKPRPRHPLLDDPVFRQYFNGTLQPEKKRSPQD